MKIIKVDSINSTQLYLKEYITCNGYKHPICVFTNNQLNGIGSRGNSWLGKEGNLFFSFVIDKTYLPDDLKLQSASIYFSFILKDILAKKGSKVWLKWPNDFYLKNKKIGGTITFSSKDLLYCGIGLNLVETSDNFGNLDIKIVSKDLLKEYFEEIKNKVSWKKIFSKFRVEFNLSKKFKTTVNNEKISLENSILKDDGSIQINNKKVFSLR